MDPLAEPNGFQWLLNLGILLVGGALCGLTALTWRRERDRKLLLVAVAYGLFALRGLAVVVGSLVEVSFELHELHPSLLVVWAEVATNLSAILVLAGLVLFFVAITRS